MKFTPEILAKEVDTLTEKFRKDKHWNDLRLLARSKGLDPETTFLAGFLETEDELEYGVFLTQAGEVIEYCRSTVNKADELKAWAKRKNIQKLESQYPAVGVGIQILRKQKQPENKITAQRLAK
jgi:hypothetical protein